MRIEKAASIPLILHDPYLSVWSSADCLYDKDTVHWSGARQRLQGFIKIDGVPYCFLGAPGECPVIPQTELDVTATSTRYTFENSKLTLQVRFTSPLLLCDPVLVSRPCTYVDFQVTRKTKCQVELVFTASGELVTQKPACLLGGVYTCPAKAQAPAFRYAMMGRADQNFMGGCGDPVTVDWGYAYLADSHPDAKLAFSEETGQLRWSRVLEGDSAGLIFAYDDLVSVNYFGAWCRAYWTTAYPTVLDAVGAAFADRETVLEKARALDADIYRKALATGGEAYAEICCLSYRQTVAAHKLICDEKGEMIFLSKENDSGGCIGTVDVSYPSVPLFLMYGTEYVKGMLRPIFRFARCDVWEADYAPHDLGRYPFAWGQMYGVRPEHRDQHDPWRPGRALPPYYAYPAGSDIYDEHMQMPVEECGNMLIMTAAICLLDGSCDFATVQADLLEKWVAYLLRYGADPGEQLCTDDFAGHLAHNANLAVKAILGIEAYALLLKQQGDTAGWEKYHAVAGEMAKAWETRALAGDHYVLAFGNADSWSLKYNLIWDKLFQSNLFSGDVYDRELAWYGAKTNEYGVPLDSRKDYTKSDWICWCAALADDRQTLEQMIAPVAHYLKNTPTRVPFGDWYDTVTGKYVQFIGRSVQGGVYMPILRAQMEGKL